MKLQTNNFVTKRTKYIKRKMSTSVHCEGRSLLQMDYMKRVNPKRLPLKLKKGDKEYSLSPNGNLILIS